MEKLTYVAVLNKVLNSSNDLSADERAKLESLRDSIAKRNAQKPNGPTKAQKANAEIGEAVAEAMEVGVAYSIPEICALVPALNGATSQKVGPLMQKLVDGGRVVKSVVKGHNYYTLA